MLNLKESGLMAGQQVNKASLLFDKIEDEDILKQKEKLENQAKDNAVMHQQLSQLNRLLPSMILVIRF